MEGRGERERRGVRRKPYNLEIKVGKFYLSRPHDEAAAHTTCGDSGVLRGDSDDCR